LPKGVELVFPPVLQVLVVQLLEPSVHTPEYENNSVSPLPSLEVSKKHYPWLEVMLLLRLQVAI
jgi:hypothetical protein